MYTTIIGMCGHVQVGNKHTIFVDYFIYFRTTSGEEVLH